MQLTKNFWLREFTKSDLATRIGRKVVPSADELTELKRLAETLQLIRDLISADRERECNIVLSSGLRPLWLNELAHGSNTSAHVFGRAGDFEIIGVSNYDACVFIATLVKDLGIDQLIYEFGDWVHVGIARRGERPRNQVLTAVRDAETGKTVYLVGLHKQEEN